MVGDFWIKLIYRLFLVIIDEEATVFYKRFIPD